MYICIVYFIKSLGEFFQISFFKIHKYECKVTFYCNLKSSAFCDVTRI